MKNIYIQFVIFLLFFTLSVVTGVFAYKDHSRDLAFVCSFLSLVTIGIGITFYDFDK